MLILVGTAISIGLLYFLMGRTHGQTRREKLAIILANALRTMPHFGKKGLCDYCARPVSSNEGQVWWREEENEWHFGHPKCLEKSGWYAPARGLMGDRRQTHRTGLQEFIGTVVPKYELWWQEAATNAKSVRARPGKPFHGAPEAEFRRALKESRHSRPAKWRWITSFIQQNRNDGAQAVSIVQCS